MLRTLLTLSIIAPILLSAQESTTKVGVLIPDSSLEEVIHACNLAIMQAGTLKGRHNLQVEVAVKTTEGPWGAGSKASVSLIYDDSVVALLCALDGRNSHLAEQVAAKTHVACIETRATDPTLTQAYVPWYLRCAPSDDQQATAIVKLILKKGGGKIAILCTGEYDSRMAVHSFIKNLAREGNSSPVILEINEGERVGLELSGMIREKGINHLVIPFNSPGMENLIPLLREVMPDLNIYGTHAFFASSWLMDSHWQSQEGMYLVSSTLPLSEQGELFAGSFQKKFGYSPGVAAAYAYDGMQMILKAILREGRDPEAIQKYLQCIQYEDGVTGSISFDELGNRKDAVRIIRLSGGKAIPVD
jgi:ABC-type branched-subunit amino acid transport system substrate-binding protein